ncbi:helix-turn-helix transcriptional regulator [Streptomyces cyaneofuscatus]|uniref:helix-turn-helix domain-containing protein n=1 Tax=Streptomyces cyaneofuscatus TaxID=66883 RepID=UPI002954C205|nr:helix-turn-helix transcriptional regulator [Streptomyces cyaneofuscatus]WOP09942.1 helix-turn-helix transcriptional regulator [Streptomyces cyaneofuscatus]
MSRWRELPAELDPAAYRLVVRLRVLKDHSGLSTRQLAVKTGYSTKSWERYLGGRTLPPHDAADAMARIAGEDPARLLALREIAAAVRQRRRTFTPAPEATTPGTPSPERTCLAAALRELKDRTGLSLAGLAERTAYSKSSWHRCLTGTTLPPRRAVQDLCRLADEPPGRCLALWEIAESTESGRTTRAKTGPS